MLFIHFILKPAQMQDRNSRASRSCNHVASHSLLQIKHLILAIRKGSQGTKEVRVQTVGKHLISTGLKIPARLSKCSFSTLTRMCILIIVYHVHVQGIFTLGDAHKTPEKEMLTELKRQNGNSKVKVCLSYFSTLTLLYASFIVFI